MLVEAGYRISAAPSVRFSTDILWWRCRCRVLIQIWTAV